MKATKALIKISRLKKRIWGIQGGQGAGKTWAILELIINHCLKNPNKEVFTDAPTRTIICLDLGKLFHQVNNVSVLLPNKIAQFSVPDNFFNNFICLSYSSIDNSSLAIS